MEEEEPSTSAPVYPGKQSVSAVKESGPYSGKIEKPLCIPSSVSDYPGKSSPSEASTDKDSLPVGSLSEKDIDSLIQGEVGGLTCTPRMEILYLRCLLDFNTEEPLYSIKQFCNDSSEKLGLSREERGRLVEALKRKLARFSWKHRRSHWPPQDVKELSVEVKDILMQARRKPTESQESNPISVKVCDIKRSALVGLAAKTLEELKVKICQHNLPGSKDNFDVVLEEDGTIVDGEYFQSLEDVTKLMVVGKGQTWTSASSSAKIGLEEVDGGQTSLSSSSSNDISTVVKRILQSVSVLAFLSKEDLKLVAEADIKDLQVMLKQSLDYATFIRDACKRRLLDMRRSEEAAVLLNSLTNTNKGTEQTGEEEPDMAARRGVTGSPIEADTPTTSCPVVTETTQEVKTMYDELDKLCTSTDLQPGKSSVEVSSRIGYSSVYRDVDLNVRRWVDKTMPDDSLFKRHHSVHMHIVEEEMENVKKALKRRGYEFPMTKWKRLGEELWVTGMLNHTHWLPFEQPNVEECCAVIKEVLFEIPRRPGNIHKCFPISVKVCDVKRSDVLRFDAGTLEELKFKICQSDLRGSKDNFDVVLEEDCTIIDEEYFQSLERDTKLMIIGKGDNMVEVDGKGSTSLATVVNRISHDVGVVPFLSEEELVLVSEADSNVLQVMLRESMHYTEEIKEACDRQLFNMMTAKNNYDFLHVWRDAEKSKKARAERATQPTTSD